MKLTQVEKTKLRTWVELDRGAIKKNYQTFKSLLKKDCILMSVVKSNAYGHGLCEIGKAAQEAGIDYLGVAHLQEGIGLRKAGVTLPILVLGAIHEDQIKDLIDNNLEFTISSKYKAELVAEKSKDRGGCRSRVHLEVDTGMQRTGVRPETAKVLLPYLKSLTNLEVVGIYSHLASADKPQDPLALKQIAAFRDLIKEFKDVPLIRHLANSGGTVYFPEAHLDMVRPSLITFGYLPESCPASFQEIKPCFSLKAKVSYFKVVKPGEGISYGHSYVTNKQTRIVTIPVGYGDGYRRSLSNRGSVLIRGKRFPICGTICMDQFMVDVGDEEVFVGDEVVLIGKQGNEEITLKEVAQLCDTIPYEILSMLNERIPRLYLTV